MLRPLAVFMAAGVAWGVCSATACLPRNEELGRERNATTGEDEPEVVNAQKVGKRAEADESKAQSAVSPKQADEPSGADDPPLTTPFHDDFERESLGTAWRATSKAWKIRDGRLCARSAKNHPAWLAYRLPVNARIEFDATSASEDGDIKAEFWGDGRSAASGVSYTDATSYLTIFGGWKNQFHVLARIDEHDDDRLELRIDPDSTDFIKQPVNPNQSYRFKVERADTRRVQWYVDGRLMHTLDDPDPLVGPGHEHFGFNDWDTPVCFDNLSVIPLE